MNKNTQFSLLIALLLALFVGNAQIQVTTFYEENINNSLSLSRAQFKDNGIFFTQLNFNEGGGNFIKLNESDHNNSTVIGSYDTNTSVIDLKVYGNDLYWIKSVFDAGTGTYIPDIYLKDLTNPNQNDTLIVSNAEIEILTESLGSISEIVVFGSKIFIVHNKYIPVDDIRVATIFYREINGPPNSPFQTLISKENSIFSDLKIHNDFLYYLDLDEGLNKFDLNNLDAGATVVSNDIFETYAIISDTEVIFRGYEFNDDPNGSNFKLFRASFEDPNNPSINRLELNAEFGNFSNLSYLNNEVYFHDDVRNADGLESSNIYKFSLPTLSTEDHSIANSVTLYPNPTSTYLTLGNLKTKEVYSVYNSIGAKIRSGQISANDKIDISSLSAGLYFFKLERKEVVMKFIKN